MKERGTDEEGSSPPACGEVYPALRAAKAPRGPFGRPAPGPESAARAAASGAGLPSHDAQDSPLLADAGAMLRRIAEPLALSEASLLALRPGLNAPVLNVEFLPVGPARAAIVVFAEGYGGIGLALGIRSSEGGQIAVFRNQESLDESVPIGEVIEPALAAAERMGFLFENCYSRPFTHNQSGPFSVKGSADFGRTIC